MVPAGDGTKGGVPPFGELSTYLSWEGWVPSADGQAAGSGICVPVSERGSSHGLLDERVDAVLYSRNGDNEITGGRGIALESCDGRSRFVPLGGVE